MVAKKTSSKKVEFSNIEKAVIAQYEKGVDSNDTASILFSEGINFSDIESLILSTAKKLKLILTDKEIAEKIKLGCEGKDKPVFFGDLVGIVKEINIPQLEYKELLKGVQTCLGVNLTEHAKFKQFNNSGYHGNIARWIKANPDFTPNELLSSGSCVDGKGVLSNNCEAYYNEFLAYKAFFE